MKIGTKSQKQDLLSGNEAIALGAYHAGCRLAAAYPGTPSTEILENFARFRDIYAEWSTNEKVAMEVGLGASYAGVRSLVAMKHVGLNVAADPLMSASITGVKGGLVIVTADDPGMHSSQNEQDNRHYARFAKIACLEPFDSQSAHDFTSRAFELSETFDTPVMVRSTTRISHSKSLVRYTDEVFSCPSRPGFEPEACKYVMLPVFARARHPKVEERLERLTEYGENCSFNKIIRGNNALGIITGGISFEYATEIFPGASFLRLGLTYPLPPRLITDFASSVERLIVIEELDPFLQNIIQAMGIKVAGKEFIPLTGELSPQVVAESASGYGLLGGKTVSVQNHELPPRPPSLCAGCPHRGLFFELNRLGRRSKEPSSEKPGLVITGDIGCYTLGTYPPLNAMDTCACMGASIGEALGMEKAGVKGSIVAVIGDSTFMHSGLTGLADAVYNRSAITIVILDNMTTAMTGHQGHPATGISARGEKTGMVNLEKAAAGLGAPGVTVVDAFDLPEIRKTLKAAVSGSELSVIIVRGECASSRRKAGRPRFVSSKCSQCKTCLRLACPAIQLTEEGVWIEPSLCAGDNCGLCEQVCGSDAIIQGPDI